MPAAYAQLALSARAGTDLDAHLDYLDHVRAFHAGLRERFYPLFFAEARITPDSYGTFPRYEPVATEPTRVPGSWPLLTIAALAAGAALLRLRHPSILPSC